MKKFFSTKVVWAIFAVLTITAASVVLQFRNGNFKIPKASGTPQRSSKALHFPGANEKIPPGPGGPILIISSKTNPFSRYYSEILRTEGFNSFSELDISEVTPAKLDAHDIIILGEMSPDASQCEMLSAWVKMGGNLIAMRPDRQLAGLLGLIGPKSSISDAYLKVDTSSGPGAGIVGTTIQFHGTADLYDLNGASSIAVLYSNARTKTVSPAVTLKDVGNNGGKAAAFTYDLARSVVYTRQGNPAWACQERDGMPPIRSNDLFCGAAGIHGNSQWIDRAKIGIPQADEQQRLLANLMITMNKKKPLPRFWYFPRELPAVIVMTGDDHSNEDRANSGTGGRFEKYSAMSAPNCSLKNWECIRGTSYIFPESPLTPDQVNKYESEGFEVALHLNTNCDNWTPAYLNSCLVDQLDELKDKYPSLSMPVTNRNHCIAWSDYATMPAAELNCGIRFDTNYYYWPPRWVGNQPGFFTGSGMPMRFADSRGELINVYQAATQMTDESDQAYPFTVDTLLDRAMGPEGFYGAFVANIHTDVEESDASDAIIQSAVARNIPVITARQMLKWVDARNASTFKSLDWNGKTLSFIVDASEGAHALTVMVPVAEGESLERIMRNGKDIKFNTVTVKGIRYASFQSDGGQYHVLYE